MAYTTFLWLIIIAIVHMIGPAAMHLRYKIAQSAYEKPSEKNHSAVALCRLLAAEFRPCMYGKPAAFERRPPTNLGATVSLLADLGATGVIIYATIVITSQIFIAFGDTI